jgi:hypothetical protein
MTNDNLCEQPIAWQVSAVDGRKDFVDSFKNKSHRERFATKALADVRKKELQAAGMVATVTPVFAPKAAQKVSLRKRQTAPFGDFWNDWRLCR